MKGQLKSWLVVIGGTIAIMPTPSCGKKVSGGGVTTGSLPGEDGPVTGGKGTSDQEIAAVQEDLLKQIRAEEAARIAKDNDLQAQISDILGRLDALEGKLVKDIARLDEEDKDIRAKMAALAETAATKKELEALGAKLVQADNEVMQRVQAELAALKKTLEDGYKAADAVLKADYQKQIDDINVKIGAINLTLTDLNKFKADTLVELAQIQKKIQDNYTEITQSIKANGDLDLARCSQLTALINANYQQLIDTGVLTAAEADKLKNCQPLAQAQVDALKARANQTQIEINNIKTAITALESSQKKTADDLAALAKKQADFEDYARLNFATKQELQSVQSSVTGLQESVRILTGDVAGIKSQISDVVLKKIDDLTTRVDGIDGRVTTLRTDFDKHMQDFHTEMNGLIQPVRDAIAAAENRLNTRIDGVDTYINTMNTSLVNLQGFVSAFMDADGKYPKKLDEIIKASSDAAYQAAVAETMAKYNELKNEVDGNRTDLQNQINNLGRDLEVVRTIALGAERVANEQAGRIDSLRIYVDNADAAIRGEMAIMRGELELRMQEIADAAEAMYEGLAADVTAQFVEVNGKLAQLTDKLDKTIRSIVTIIMPVVTDPAILAAFDRAQAPLSKEATQKLFEYRVAQHRLEEAFIQAIDPVLASKGVDVRAMNLSFRAIAGLSQCNGFPGVGDDFSAIGPKEWFFHLARIYVRDLVTATRSGSGHEVIYFGLPKLYVSENDLRSLAIVGASESYAAGTQGDCAQRVRAWGLDLLNGSPAISVALRRAMVNSIELQRAVNDLYVKANFLTTPFNALVKLVSDTLIQAVGNNNALYNANGNTPAIIAQLAGVLLEGSSDAATLDEIRAVRENYVDLAVKIKNEICAASPSPGPTPTSSPSNAPCNLKAQIDNLNKKIDDYIQATDRRIGALEGATKTSFNLIASIASRLGYEDIVAAAKAATESIGGTLTILPPAPLIADGCRMAQHWYTHITNPALPSVECVGAPNVSGNLLTGDNYTKCAVHATGGEYGYTWGNTGLVSNGWSAMTQAAGGGHTVNDGLMMSNLDPISDRAIALGKLKAGSMAADHRNPTSGVLEAALNFRIVGKSSARWKLTARTITSTGAVNTTNPQVEERIVDAGMFKVGGTNGDLAYNIPSNFAISPLGACRWDREVIISAVDAFNNAIVGASQCVLRFHQFSPIVLDLTGSETIETVNPILSSTYFDLDGNGRSEKTGWTKRGNGLLVLDVNGNGKIDNGRELFGEATLLKNGKRAEHGYAAMAQYDSNKDGRLDAKDEIYGKLRIWLDSNSDGESQGHELYTLNQLNVLAISTNHRDVASEDVVQNHGLPESNLVKYESRFWGPSACGLAGCKSYDVFFGSTESYNVSSN